MLCSLMSPAPRPVDACRVSVERSSTIDELSGLLEVHGAFAPETILDEARAAAMPLLAAGEDEAGFETFLATAISLTIAEGEPDLTGLSDTLVEAQGLTGVPPMAVALRVLSDPAFLALPLDVATEICMDLLRELAPVHKVWLWTGDPASASHW